VPQGKMEALRDAMEKKRKEREEAAAAGGGGGKKKWVRRGELEAQREAAYREEMAAAEASRKLVVPCLRRYEGEGDAAAAVDNTGTGAALVGGLSAAARAGGVGAGGASSAGGDMVHLEPKEVKRLLRQLGQPVQLFGEEDEARLERYRAVAAATEKEDDAELKAGQMFNETQLYDESGKAKAAVDEEEMGGEEANTVEGTISRHFKGLLRLWEEELSARSEAVANSAAGRKEMATYLQCRRHLKPFFRQLKARVMPPDILRHIETITEHMAAREYVKAHDAYILCAIGNAPWPMGITGTGVHERQGRQHIQVSKIAHVMNDETQRKYLQSVKRLLTFAQKALPPDGPSKTVN